MTIPWYKKCLPRARSSTSTLRTATPDFLADFDAEHYVGMVRRAHRRRSCSCTRNRSWARPVYPSQGRAGARQPEGPQCCAQGGHRRGAPPRPEGGALHELGVGHLGLPQPPRLASERHPSAAHRGHTSAAQRLTGAGLCCVNSPYRDYTMALTREICETFDMEGIRMDMTFWPRPLLLPPLPSSLRRRSRRRNPEIVNCGRPALGRPSSAAARSGDGRVRRAPDEYRARSQSRALRRASGLLAASCGRRWRFGVDSRLAQQNTYLQGDFYGGTLQGSLVRKLFYNLSPDRPVGFETCVSLSPSPTTRP